MKGEIEVSVKTPVELFDTYVGNLAGHAGHLATATGRIRMGAVPGVWAEYFVEPKGETPDVWDRCYFVEEDGKRRSLGNRHGMTQHYAKLCAEALRAFAVDKELAA
jgi:hypothetical protein